MSALEPIPVGTLVDYHGSHTHGRYIITQHEPVRAGVPDPENHYPDGVGYVIWPENAPQKFGNRDRMISQVRRASLTVVAPGGEMRTLDISDYFKTEGMEYWERIQDAIDLAADQGQNTWLTQDGRNAAAIVTVDMVEFARRHGYFFPELP